MGDVCVCGCRGGRAHRRTHAQTVERTVGTGWELPPGPRAPLQPTRSAARAGGGGPLHLVCCSGQSHAPDVHCDTLHATELPPCCTPLIFHKRTYFVHPEIFAFCHIVGCEICIAPYTKGPFKIVTRRILRDFLFYERFLLHGKFAFMRCNCTLIGIF